LRKHRRSSRRLVKPDDYFGWGPFEFARFEKTTIYQSHATPEQAAAGLARMADHFPTVVTEIDALVSSIAAQIASLPPGLLLHRAWWEFAAITLGIGRKEAREVGPSGRL